eukprot:gene5435-5980_t
MATGFGKSKPSQEKSKQQQQQQPQPQRHQQLSSTTKVKPPNLYSMTSDIVKDNKPFIPISSDEIPALPTEHINLTASNHVNSINLQYPGIKVISYDPPVLQIDPFFSKELCESYVAMAERKGKQIASQTFSSLTSTARTSTTWYLYYNDVKDFIERAYNLTRVPINQYEEPQIVRYELGQQFSWHYDAVPSELVSKTGQRLLTLLVYLNDVQTGGATCFKELNLKVQPKQGRALLFFPSFRNGTSDDRTLHAGQVALDTKWLLQMWIHDRPYQPVIPSDNSYRDFL